MERHIMTSINNSRLRQHKIGAPQTIFLQVMAGILLLSLSSAHAFQDVHGMGGEQGNANAAYQVGLWGALPYSAIPATVGLPNLIADMNRPELRFTGH